MAGSNKDAGKSAPGGFRLSRELVGLAAIFTAAFLCVALYTYNDGDPGFNQSVTRRVVANKAGLVGAYVGGALADLFGLWAYLVPLGIAWRGLRFLAPGLRLPFWRGLGAFCLTLVLLAFLGSPWGLFGASLGGVRGGGVAGQHLFGFLNRYLSSFGAYFFLAFALIAAIQVTFGLTWTNFWLPVLDVAKEKGWRLYDAWLAWREERALARETAREERLAREEASPSPAREKKPAREKRQAAPRSVTVPADPAPEEAPSEAVDRFLDAIVGQVARKEEPPAALPAVSKPVSASAPDPVTSPAPKPAPVRAAKAPAKKASADDNPMPSLDLLAVPPPSEAAPADPEVCRQQAESLITCLNDFGIQCEVTRVIPGPVVTMFEVKPAPGVKISRIVGLSVDLALAMKALAVRIEPLPGKDTVGVEIPNARRQTVYFRDVLDTEAFRASPSKLTLAIGKDIQGRPQVADLARMPHLLVAGATGSGKSVCINGILLSILYKATPDEVKLLLVDPKRIELSVYNDLPHLVHPVVTETAMAKSALDWAVAEMDRRYEAMALLGVRNIAGYNEKLAKLGDNRPDELAELEPLPYLVIVIDELADLMMTAAKEVEVSIVRLAQLARAAGIHLILATQRPSVDVVTGLIKANFPTRIAFQVTSKHDSRTILDAVGAEYLLGRGDMLYKPSGGKTTRMHGAFVSDEEAAAVIEHWKSKAAPNFALDFSDWQKSADGNGGGDFGGGEGGDDTASDAVYPQAVEFVMEQGKASISLIQRRFRIGFNRAARFIEQMERDGLLGPQEGSKPRAVIRNKE
ncbi:cell division FtsK/SpoIIIE protein [Solidesulfovibrio fructosivorans JJ]]|uniref:Cell division FtsK/SpoIIIE protein n=1 Tax=Solidesulfovibrio fructosivorans JJ] TaxID=596151 RepID=E1JYU6_SOLFR|nr:DNA translocase FtsK [Solidesulfovibrio fructosivorans]EFL50516.1 cell division FtsK/SpoIIIE protein [Solidesulfovibrio fructosivorans JJ]]